MRWLPDPPIEDEIYLIRILVWAFEKKAGRSLYPVSTFLRCIEVMDTVGIS
jgi:hypothetical protein